MFKGEVSVVMLLEQVSHLSRYHAVKKMERLDLRPGQMGILFILNDEGSMSQKKLAQKMGITPPSMTAALKKLEGSGYVIKETDSTDQRVFNICLSEKGEECIQELKDIEKDIEETVLQGITYEEKLFLRRLLLEMRKNLVDDKEFRGMDICTIMGKTHPSHLPDKKGLF